MKLSALHHHLETLGIRGIAKTILMAFRQGNVRTKFGANVHSRMLTGSNIDGKGSLTLGAKWLGLRFQASEFLLQNGAKVNVDDAFSIYTGFHIALSSNARLSLGSGYINSGVTIDCFESIRIGHYVVISKGVTIRDSDNHQFDNNTPISAPITIGDHVWIGINVTILKGVNIGDGAVVAAGAVVVSDVAPNTLVGGVPAKLIRENVTWN